MAEIDFTDLIPSGQRATLKDQSQQAPSGGLSFDDLIPTNRVDQGFQVAATQPARPELSDALAKSAAAASTGGARSGGGGVLETIDAGMRNAADAMTFGTADEIAAGIRTGAGLWGNYDQALAQERAINNFDQNYHPVASVAGQIGGAVAGGLGVAKAAPGLAKVALGGGAKTLPGKIVQSAASGGVLGGAHGLGSGEGDLANRAQQASMEAALGGGLGAVAPVAGAVVGQTVGRMINKAPPPAPTVEALKAAGNAAYDQADKAGVWVSQPSFSKFSDELMRKLADEGIDPNITPKAAAAAERIRQATTAPLRLRDVETLRKVAGNAAKSNEPAERYFGAQIREGLDSYLSGLAPGDVVAGNAREGIGALKEARGIWSRMRKGELLDEALQGANLQAAVSGSGANIDNATRQRVRALIINRSTRNLWTSEEKQALLTVAKGTPTGNALRLIGKLAPTGVVSSALSSGAGFTAAGPLGAVVAPAAGFAAKKGADAITARQLKIAAEMIRRGYPAPKRGSPIAAAYAQLVAQGAGQGATAEIQAPRQPLQVTVTRPANWIAAQPR